MEDFPKTCGMVGSSAKMLELYKDIERVAPTDATVFIRGESGTGKELVARAIHIKSLRKGKPFRTYNCAAVPTELLESDLFGHQKGAFTGAYTTKEGKLEIVNGGTLFLDEIADMSLKVQPKLPRVLEYQEFERVGGTETKNVDVRLIAATSKDVENLISNDRFRRELYYRINVFPIYVPSLRERQDDMPLLTDYFIHKNKGKGISPEAKDKLVSYEWIGNVRQLENTIKRLVIYSMSDMESEPQEISLDLVERYGKPVDMPSTKNKDSKPETLLYDPEEGMIMLEKGTQWIKRYLNDHETSMNRLMELFREGSALFGNSYGKSKEETGLAERAASVENDLAAIRESFGNISNLPERLERIEKYIKEPHEKPAKPRKSQDKKEPKRLSLREFAEQTEIPLSTLYAPIKRGSMKSESRKGRTVVNGSFILDYFTGSRNEYAVKAVKQYAEKNPGFEVYIPRKGS